MKYLTRKKIIQTLYCPFPKLIYGRIFKDCCGVKDLYTNITYQTNRYPFKYDWQGWMLLKEYCFGFYNIKRIIQHPIYKIIGESINEIQIQETILLDEKEFKNDVIIHPYVPKSEVIGKVISPTFNGLIWDFKYIDNNQKRLLELRQLFNYKLNSKKS